MRGNKKHRITVESINHIHKGRFLYEDRKENFKGNTYSNRAPIDLILYF